MDWFDNLLNLFSGSSTGGTLPSYMDIQKMLQQMYGQGRTDINTGLRTGIGYEMPFLIGGQGALSNYLGSLGIGTPNQQKAAQLAFQASPSYKFQLQQGTQAAERAAAARGMTGSGAEQQALQRIGQGLANQEYGQWQQRLANLSGLGAQTASGMAGQQLTGGTSLANLGLGYGKTISDLYGRLAGIQGAEMPYQMAGLGELGSGIGSLLAKYGPSLLSFFGL
jgi:hypothetical protein